MKFVAVSQRVDLIKSRNERRDALDQRLVSFIAAAGGYVVPVPNNLVYDMSIKHWLAKLSPTSIVLSGGNNIGEDNFRDQTESILINYAEEKKLPILGICRGMQMLGSWAGAKIHQVKRHVGTRHQLKGKITINVNSFHEYSLSNCPVGFDVLATSEDGEIEAIRHQELPWEGWMWHPERENKFNAYDIYRLTKILNQTFS